MSVYRRKSDICRRLAVMKKGHFLFAGSVQELEGQYILSAKQYVEDGSCKS